jgi:hypothetical protein
MDIPESSPLRVVKDFAAQELRYVQMPEKFGKDFKPRMLALLASLSSEV